MNHNQSNQRYIRQQDIVPVERLRACRVTIIGVGAIGRQVALQLAAMGVGYLQLIDFDRVEQSNLASQGYLESDLGKPKIEATGELCVQINSNLTIELIQNRFRRSTETGNIVFCAVDSIDSRRFIWDVLKDKVSFFCDGRMTAEVLRVVTACDLNSRQHYPETLFRTNEAYAGPCTGRTTIYCANIAAGFMIVQFAKYLRQMPVEADLQVNLLASEMTIE